MRLTARGAPPVFRPLVARRPLWIAGGLGLALWTLVALAVLRWLRWLV